MKNVFLILFLTFFLTACGTTSGIQQVESNDAEKTTTESNDALTLDLSKYNSIIVRTFSDGTKKQNLPKSAALSFAEIIESSVKGTSAFEKVVINEEVDGEAIIIDGVITLYKKGNAALRGFVGFGAGSSYFNATVVLKDAKTQEEIGQIIVDKNSWALGGLLAASQTVDTFMTAAGNKIAQELAKAKKGTESK